MKRNYSFLILILLALACGTVPLTDRRQLNLLPGSQMRSLSFEQYGQVLKESRVLRNTPESKMLKEVGANIADAVERYLKKEKQADIVEDFEWEFNLIDDPAVNAWCMPAGKVAFYSGIMPICRDANGVAVVMGHEIAHAIARHGNERMSQGLVQQAGGIALSVALRDKPEETQAMFMMAYGVGSTVGGMLPFSRLHESEADQLGLTFMAMAGYDPSEAPEFWGRMAERSNGQPPEFLSTHPSHETRIANLKKWMPEAQKHYKQSAAK